MATVSIEREIGSMINEEPWLFVGIPDSIKVPIRKSLLDKKLIYILGLFARRHSAQSTFWQTKIIYIYIEKIN